jgi:hypothetical protein
LEDITHPLNLLAKVMIKINAEKEDWMSHFEAIDGLRILNKFHFDVLEKSIDNFKTFLLS